MKNIILAFCVLASTQIFAQKHTDAHIIGHVTSGDEHIAFANIMVKNTTIGTSTDETGHFTLLNMPEGKFTVIAKALGYKTEEREVLVKARETIEIKFELKKDVFGLNEVIITGDRNQKNQKELPIIINTLSPKQLETNNSVTISEGLNFCSGLRVENNCQNCGFNQLRMNGMEGPYSQILINSRAIFSGLASVYGLELIPTNMIERVEIIRGGGSALYGSNAIAGTVNMILKDPITNSYEFGSTANLPGMWTNKGNTISPDFSVNMNTSVVSSDSRTGMSIYGFHRNKTSYDANNDGFSEQSKAKNTTIGTRIFHRFNQKNKIALDYFSINESRRGGNLFNNLPHMTDITESVEHSINTAAINFDHFVRSVDQISVYASAQHVIRDSYYGADYSLTDYGKTKDLSWSAGMQYTMREEKSTLVAGIENSGTFLNDVKLGHPDFNNAVIAENQIVSIPFIDNILIANQFMNTNAAFAQYDYRTGRWKFSVGSRFDNYLVANIEDRNSDKAGNVISPRANILFDVSDNLQSRISYSKGFRAPQIFDEDLHIESSGSRQVLHRNAADLKQESSHSISASLDLKKHFGSKNINFLIEGFYTILLNPFVNEYGIPDENGTVIYTRANSEDGAIVKGLNFELNMFPHENIAIKSGFTLQQSTYEKKHEFGENRFFRSPGEYGFFTFDFSKTKFGISSTGTYTGKMLVPYFGNTLANPEDGELRTSKPFFDLGIKAKYNLRINGAVLQLFAGIKNIFNSYQNDFDNGSDRDPAYIYGPTVPRTIYVGIKLGNNILY